MSAKGVTGGTSMLLLALVGLWFGACAGAPVPQPAVDHDAPPAQVLFVNATGSDDILQIALLDIGPVAALHPDARSVTPHALAPGRNVLALRALHEPAGEQQLLPFDIAAAEAALVVLRREGSRFALVVVAADEGPAATTRARVRALNAGSAPLRFEADGDAIGEGRVAPGALTESRAIAVSRRWFEASGTPSGSAVTRASFPMAPGRSYLLIYRERNGEGGLLWVPEPAL